MSVQLIIVSHSARLAEGIVELAAQMAGDVQMHAVGGTDEGGIGTSFDRVQAAVAAVIGDSDEAVVLCDLGSAVMTAESVIEFLDEDEQARVRLADAPIVEGAVAAAVAAQSGATLLEVLSAAQSAGGAGEIEAQEPAGAETSTATVELINESGLHARPASELTKLASKFDAEVTVNGVNAKSLLSIMALGLTQGSSVTYAATGTDAQAAVDALVRITGEGFGE